MNLLFVDSARPTTAYELQATLSSPELVNEERLFVVERAASVNAYPRFDLQQRPDPALLSEMLFLDYSRARELLLTQRGIAQRITQLIEVNPPDVVLYVVVDGLGYYDLADKTSEPCLVEGPTLTEYGFREAMGHPPLAQRLFHGGYRSQVAFTYFDPNENQLSADLHKLFGGSQIVRVIEFSDIVTHPLLTMAKGFIQVTMPGLDGLSHQHRDRPPITTYRDRILEQFQQLIEVIERDGRSVYAFLTSDHGILWREFIPDNARVVSGAYVDDAYHPRYFKGAIVRDYARPVHTAIGGYSLLRYPYLTRRLRRNEWGVHGGISAWESLVPFFKYRT